MKAIGNFFTGLLKLCVILPMIVGGAVLFGWLGSYLPGLWALPGMLAGYILGCVVGGWLGALITGWETLKSGGYGNASGGPIPSSYQKPNYGINPANGLPMRSATHDICWNLKFHDYHREQAAEQQRIRDQWERRY